MLNKKTWTNQQTKNHKKDHDLDWSRTHVFQFLTSQIPSMQNTVNLQGFNKFITKEMFYLVSVDCNSMALHLTSSDCAGF